jgi:uncharacterized protein YoxC
MSPLLTLCAVVVTIAIAAIAIAVLRAMRSFELALDEFRKTADVARASIAEIDVVTRQIRELAVSMESVVTPLKQTSQRIARIGERVALLGERAVRLSDAVLTQIESPVHQTVALMTGVRTGTQTLWSRLAGRITGRMGHATSNGGYRHE